jgi:putative oxidoreductase
MANAHGSRTDLGLLLIRLVVGVVFVFHGVQKLFGLFDGGGIEGTAQFFEGQGIPMAKASAVLAGLAELLGGLSLITGAWMRLLAIPLIVTMAVAILTVHRGAFAASAGGMEFPLTLGVVVLGLWMTGPGRIAIHLGAPRK